MATKQRVNELREALIEAVGINFDDEELAVLAGRLRFDSTPALSQQQVADGIGYSQPHISNVERRLLGRFKAQADRRRKASRNNVELYGLLDDLKAVVEAIDETTGPRLVLKKKRRSS